MNYYGYEVIRECDLYHRIGERHGVKYLHKVGEGKDALYFYDESSYQSWLKKSKRRKAFF